MKTFSHLLRFRRSDQTIQVSLAGLQRMEETISRLEAVDLSLEEWTRAQRYRNENARALWILGRLAAKRALFQLEPTAVLSSLSVQSAVTGTPYFQGLESSYEVSITHSKSVALALVSPMRHPVTIDLESIRTERVAAITKMLTDRESQLASETEDPIRLLLCYGPLKRRFRSGCVRGCRLIFGFWRSSLGSKRGITYRVFFLMFII